MVGLIIYKYTLQLITQLFFNECQHLMLKNTRLQSNCRSCSSNLHGKVKTKLASTLGVSVTLIQSAHRDRDRNDKLSNRAVLQE